MPYIDEDVLYDNIEEKYKVAKGDARSAYSDVLDTICEIPTADVQEVRHGRWIEDGETGCLICSICGRFTDEIIGDIIEADEDMALALGIPPKTKIHRSMNPFYCSKCGAKMDGGAE